MKKKVMASTAKKCAKTSVAVATAVTMCMSIGIEFNDEAMRAAMHDMEAEHDAKVIQMWPEFDGFIA